MEVLRFTLSGRHGFFKKPEVNSYYYFTYGNIHKVALLGMFGAILGYGGYTQMQVPGQQRKWKKLEEGFPEFYERLKDLHISILPSSEIKKGIIPKKVQTFNNSVGYASGEQGGNLIVKEQWLENPRWEICLLLDSEEAEKVKDAVCRRKCVYYPYLGKNDHPADIGEIKTEQVTAADFGAGRLDCLALKEEIMLAEPDYNDEIESDVYYTFKYEEALPYKMDGWTNHYILKPFVYTDCPVEVEQTTVYRLADGKSVVFY